MPEGPLERSIPVNTHIPLLVKLMTPNFNSKHSPTRKIWWNSGSGRLAGLYRQREKRSYSKLEQWKQTRKWIDQRGLSTTQLRGANSNEGQAQQTRKKADRARRMHETWINCKLQEGISAAFDKQGDIYHEAKLIIDELQKEHSHTATAKTIKKN